MSSALVIAAGQAKVHVADGNEMMGPPPGYFYIEPSTKFMQKWDFFMLALLLFTASVTPYEVAFLQPQFDFLFAINRLVDLAFVADMVLNFFLCYNDKSGQLVWERKKIAFRYLRFLLISFFFFSSFYGS